MMKRMMAGFVALLMTVSVCAIANAETREILAHEIPFGIDAQVCMELVREQLGIHLETTFETTNFTEMSAQDTAPVNFFGMPAKLRCQFEGEAGLTAFMYSFLYLEGDGDPFQYTAEGDVRARSDALMLAIERYADAQEVLERAYGLPTKGYFFVSDDVLSYHYPLVDGALDTRIVEAACNENDEVMLMSFTDNVMCVLICKQAGQGDEGSICLTVAMACFVPGYLDEDDTFPIHPDDVGFENGARAYPYVDTSIPGSLRHQIRK